MNRLVSPFWAAVVLAGFVGWLCGVVSNTLPIMAPRTDRVTRMPAPWRVPHLPGMGELRLAMIHDVLTGRYVVRSPAWYRARNARRQAAITVWEATGAAPTAQVLADMDDLAVGLERLGDSAAAEAVMRRKAGLIGLETPRVLQAVAPPQVEPRWEVVAHDELRVFRERGELSEADHQRYTTLANLGTVLIHGHLRGLFAGQQADRAAVEEGLACLHEAVRINPAAHLGRETWQIVAVEHLLAVAKDPALRLRFTLVGDPWFDEPPVAPSSGVRGHQTLFTWEQVVDGSQKRLQRHDWRFSPDWTPAAFDASLKDDERMSLRGCIVRVACDPAWVAAVSPSRRIAAPFDEPVLGLLGMWMFGGGPNPHSALALATICERIGQRHLAVEAYERCAGLAATFSPDPAERERLVAHCRERQEALAAAVAPFGAGAWLERLRRGFADELAWADQRRHDQHAAEERILATGVDPDDPALNPAKLQTGPPLASPPGTADEYWATPDSGHQFGDGFACAVLAAAAMAALLTAGSTASERLRR